MKVKDRKIYELSNFRGLDSENKQIKVAPFRATSGKNFVIDSGTLKTRPSFDYKETPLTNNATIIDFYKFRDVMVYITNKGFYFKKDNVILSPLTKIMKLHTKILNRDGFFSNVKPLFQEEKECLFVFCLNDIYVISIINEEGGKGLVLYTLNDKPTKTEIKISGENKDFDNLPTPYIPTLFIGDKALEDINLLSNKSKYQFYAKAFETEQGKYITEYMPTNYKMDKNGLLNEIAYDVKVYDGEYNTTTESPFFNIFPFYLGKHNEDFFGDINKSYGEFIYDNEKSLPTKINKGYVAKEPFKYYKEAFEEPKPTKENIIKEVLGLTRKEFYDLRIEKQERTLSVYEFILDYIKNNNESITDNKVFTFEVPFICTKEYIDRTNNSLYKIVKSEEVANIYVQLLVNEDVDLGVQKTTQGYNQSSTEQTIPSSYPEYPPYIDSTPIIKPIDIWVSPKEETFATFTEFLKDANTYIDTKISKDFALYKGLIQLKGQSMKTQKIYQEESFNTRNDAIYWAVGEVDSGELPPGFNSEGATPFDIGEIKIDTEERFDIRDFEYKAVETLKKKIQSEKPGDIYNGVCYFTAHTFYEWNYANYISERRKCAFFFTYNTFKDYTEYTKYSYVMYALISANSKRSANENLFTFSYNEKIGAFVFKYKNFFYNYSIEPAIDILMTFSKNKDYDIIANSTFGIPFGSENRLFLAGNKDYPNIDRYNISNDLLGDNVKNQSYELSYYPSKNYRVIGGKGAINGYIIATDTQLYITKENYPNDQKLYIRNRVMDDKGIVGYNEFKTNIGVSPLNSKCTARFYNDIVLLSNEGLYGLEIASNVLTNERLIKLRSSFINRELKNAIKKNKDIFIYEDNKYLDIIIDNIIYVADSRYVDKNPNGEISNYSYEFVKWELPFYIKNIRKIEDEMYILDSSGKNLYTLGENNNDTYIDSQGKSSTKPIELQWQSALTDFNSKLYEKTMFRANVFATKQDKENTVNIGYRTMRRNTSFDDIKNNKGQNVVDLSNANNLEQVFFNLFAINTFREFGTSIPMKENNFLYIQFLILGTGKIEINSIEIEYKNNRLLKTLS